MPSPKSRLHRHASHSPPPGLHSCSSDCMLHDHHHRHPLRQHPPSILFDEDTAYSNSTSSTCYSPAPSPLQDFPSPGSQRSLTTSLFEKVKIPPIVTNTASRASFQFASSRTASPERSRPRSPTKENLRNWFVGASAPVAFGITASPTRETPFPDSEDYFSPEMEAAYTARPSRGRTSSSASQSQLSSGIASKFSWITKGIAASPTSTAPSRSPTISSVPLDPRDELLELDVGHALLPHGTPDVLAPSSFHDLLAASEALCHRYQAAYRAQAYQIRDLRAEKDAEKEELDEAETRARHLKTQLDSMAVKAKEQEEAMRALSLELLTERRRREDEERARKKSVQLVRTKPHQQRSVSKTPAAAPRPAPASSDSGFESDSESTAPRSRSASSLTAASNFDPAPSPTLAGADDDGYSFEEEHHEGQRMQADRRLSTYDKVLKTVAGEPASAWAVLEGFREENRLLRARVGELEEAVGNCLDMVACMGV